MLKSGCRTVEWATVQHGRVCSSDDLDSEASLQMDGSWRLVMIEERSQVLHGTLALGHVALGFFYRTTGTPRIAAAYRPLPSTPFNLEE